MRKLFKSVVLISAVGLFFGSCTIQKRLYSSGYYVQWNHTYKGSNDFSAEPVTENSAQLLNEKTQNESIVFEESIVTNNLVSQEIDGLSSVLSTENNTSVITQSTEIKSDNSSIDESKFTGQYNPVKLKSKSAKFVKPLLKKTANSDSNSAGAPDKGLLIILCFFIPWLAVGLATNWDVKAIIFNLLWSLTCIGGIIHALVVVGREA